MDTDNTLTLILGFVALLATLWLGLFTYARNARGTRLAHMHKLFGDYLAHEFNFQLAKAEGKALGDPQRSLAAFKMYTLEEMWLWLENEKNRPPRFYLGSQLKVARDVHTRLVTGWTNTIHYHLGLGDLKELVEFLTAHSCYSRGFVDLVLDHHPHRNDRKVMPLRRAIECERVLAGPQIEQSLP